jgi:hypothetical protein
VAAAAVTGPDPLMRREDDDAFTAMKRRRLSETESVISTERDSDQQ